MADAVDGIQLRVYVEGVLLSGAPVGGFSCTYRRAGPATGRLDIAALPGLREEEWGRLHVAVFWSDADIRDAAPGDWPLLYEGEISGFGQSATPASREVSFRLISVDIYLDQCKHYYYDASVGPNSQASSSVSLEAPRRAFFFGTNQVNPSVAAPGLSTTNRIIAEMQKSSDKSPSAMARRVFKDTLPSINHFFTLANERLGLDRRYVIPQDSNLASLYANVDLFLNQMKGNVSSKEADVSMSSILDDALALMRYQRLLGGPPVLVKSVTGKTKTPANQSAALAVIDANVIRRTGLSTEELGLTATLSDDAVRAIANENVVGLLDAAMSSSAPVDSDELDLLQRVDLTDEDLAAADESRRISLGNFLIGVRDELRRLQAPAVDGSSSVLIPSDADQADDDLAQFLLIPETFFSAIPTCNVFFPTHTNSSEFERDFTEEPTRLMASIPAAPSDGLNKVWFAPQSMLDTARVASVAVRPPPGSGGFRSPLPLDAIVFGSAFGTRPAAVARTDGKATEPHKGQDFRRLPIGTPVFAVHDGTIELCGPQKESDLSVGLGNRIRIRGSGGMATVYGHLSAFEEGIHRGATVSAGQTIGRSGNTGRSSGPHLHFEHHQNGVQIDPRPLLDSAIAHEEEILSGDPARAKQEIFTPEQSVTDLAKSGDRFDDYRFLTPEEDQLGIIPAFDDSMDSTELGFERNADPEQLNTYLAQHTQARFFISKYRSRGGSSVAMPWSPGVVAGMPGLFINERRSIIACVDSVTSSYRNTGSCGTSVSYSMPRYWDEGDPYAWTDGRVTNRQGVKVASVPDERFATFPISYLSDLVPTNSYKQSPVGTPEPFGGTEPSRPVDKLLKALVGVAAIPHFAGRRINQATGAEVSFNEAIDGRLPDGSRSAKTILGHYKSLLENSQSMAHGFAQSFTRRLGVTETQFMADFLGATRQGNDFVGGPFREKLQGVVRAYLAVAASDHTFKG